MLKTFVVSTEEKTSSKSQMKINNVGKQKSFFYFQKRLANFMQSTNFKKSSRGKDFKLPNFKEFLND